MKSRWMRRTAAALVALLMVSCSATQTARAEPEPPGPPTVSAVKLASAPVREGPDFDGDGYADLAVPGSDYDSGADYPYWVVNIIFGSSKGLTARRNQLWRQLDFSDHVSPRHSLASTAAGDFDGDGFTDLALGTFPGGPDLVPLDGAVRILYGSPTGLQRARSQYFTSKSPGLPRVDEPEDDSFGTSLVAANFGRSRQADLAIGAKYRKGGQVTVLYGSVSGLTALDSQLWSQGTAGVPGVQGPGDGFGTSLAAGRFAGSPYADLAVGVPHDGGKQGSEGPGAVNIIYGSSSGLTAQGSQLWSQRSRGIKGKPVDGEQFGSDLAAGHFAGRDTADLAVGVRAGSDAGEYSGAVNVLYGTGKGLSAKGDQLWTPRSKGLTGKRYLDSFFGDVLTVGNFGRDRRGRHFDDLAVTASTDYEKDGLGGSMGVVQVIYGSSTGLAVKGNQSWRWDTAGVKGNPDPLEDSYGDTLVAADFGNGPRRSRYADLAVGDPIVPAGSTYGAVSVLPGTKTGLSARGDQRWTIQKLHRRIPRFFAEVTQR